MNNINTPPGVITCKAAVLRKAGEALQIEEIKVDPPKAYEIRIKMLYASICHTDSLCDNVLYPLFPMVPGHEGVGQIESVGDKVTNLKEGDFVVPLYIGECGECLNCTSGKTNLCHKYPINMSGLMLDGTSRMTSVLGEKLYHHITCSTWSEYTVVEAGYVAKVDPLLPPSHASFLSCGFATGFGSTYRVVDIEKGSTVAVVGLGPVGLGVVKGAQMLGATKIIGIDANDLKQEKARKFGVTEYINPKSSDKTVSELVKDATGGLGVDYCFECTGVPNLLNEAIEGSKVGLGTVVLIGAGVQTSGELDYVPLLLGRTVKGCIYGGIRPQLDLPNIIQKCLNKEIDLDQLITHEFSIGEINKALEHTKHPDSLKIVLKF